MSYELSFSQRVLDGALSYGINLYYIDGDNMIMTVPTDGKPKNVNTGKIETGALKQYRLPHYPALACKCQLQLAAHGESGDCRSRT